MNWFKSKSFFHKVLGYFGLILVVPVCTILLLYFQAEQTVKNQIQISGRNTLNQFFRAVDIALDEMQDIAWAVVLDEACQQYAMNSVYDRNRLSYQSYETQKSLKSLVAERYQDVFAYFPNADRVVSRKNASVSAEYYYNIYFDKNNEAQRAQFENIIHCDSKQPKLYVLDGDVGNTMLCMAVLRQHRDVRQNYVAAVILSPDYLNSLLDSEELFEDSGNLLLYGAEKELLFTNGEVPIVLPEGDIEGYGFFEAEVDGKSYVVQVKQSEEVEGYYAHMMPGTYYWQQLASTRWVYIIGLLACAIISIIIAYRLCSRAYRPVEQMLHNIQKHTDSHYNRLQDSEFEYVENMFQKESEKIFGLKQKAKSGQAAMLERFVVQLLDGSVPEQTGDDIFIENGMTLYSDRFCVAVLMVEPTIYESLLSFILENVFCELCDERHKGYVVSLPGRRYGILLNLRSPLQSDGEIREILQKGKEFLHNYGGLVLSMGISQVREGMSQIHTAFREADKALWYRYLYGTGCLIEYAQIKNREVRYHAIEESRLFLQLLGYITEEEVAAPEEYVRDLFLRYGVDEESAMETVDGFVTELLNTLNMLFRSRNYPVPEKEEWMNRLGQVVTLKHLQVGLAEIMKLLRGKEQDYAGAEDVYHRVREYIKKHYKDKELSLTVISSHFGISSSYLSRLFKETYNISIPDYIAQTRVKAGKSLLRDTDNSVIEIAECCGFLSSNVFIKAFKKYEGITPGVYRKLLSEDIH